MMHRLAALALAFALALGAPSWGVGVAEAAPLLNKLYVAADAANLRAAPTLSARVVGTVGYGGFVMVSGPVVGEMVEGNPIWYRTQSGNYIAEVVTTNAPGSTGLTFTGPPNERWIDIDVSANRVRAMQGDVPVFVAKVVTGRPGLDTPLGTFRVQWRVKSRTMDSSTVGIPLDEPDAYLIPRVRWAQYFTNEGHAIHGNYWVPPELFGSGKTSRGCVGLANADAMVLWDFAGPGTKVVIHQ